MLIVLQLTSTPFILSVKIMSFSFVIVVLLITASDDKRWSFTKWTIDQSIQFFGIILSEVLLNWKIFYIQSPILLCYLFFEMSQLSRCIAVSFGNNRNDINQRFDPFNYCPISFTRPWSRQKEKTTMYSRISLVSIHCTLLIFDRYDMPL